MQDHNEAVRLVENLLADLPSYENSPDWYIKGVVSTLSRLLLCLKGSASVPPALKMEMSTILGSAWRVLEGTGFDDELARIGQLLHIYP
jgi:hypothetical protein